MICLCIKEVLLSNLIPSQCHKIMAVKGSNEMEVKSNVTLKIASISFIQLDLPLVSTLYTPLSYLLWPSAVAMKLNLV